jgi:hypothetical protein
MAVVVISGIATPGANTKSADLVSGTYAIVGAGKITVISKASITGILATCLVGGTPLVNDQMIPYTGTAGTLSVNDNIIASQQVQGGKIEFYLRNNTATAGTTADYMILYEPSR